MSNSTSVSGSVQLDPLRQIVADVLFLDDAGVLETAFENACYAVNEFSRTGRGYRLRTDTGPSQLAGKLSRMTDEPAARIQKLIDEHGGNKTTITADIIHQHAVEVQEIRRRQAASRSRRHV